MATTAAGGDPAAALQLAGEGTRVVEGGVVHRTQHAGGRSVRTSVFGSPRFVAVLRSEGAHHDRSLRRARRLRVLGAASCARPSCCGVGMTESARSFARTLDEQRERRLHGRRLVGLSLARVRYVNIDYRRFDLAPEHQGPRTIVDECEWQDPTWRYDGFDSIDHGVELEAVEGRLFTVTWDSPGWTKGICLRENPLVGHAVVPEADVAVWDVTERSGWADVVGHPVRDVLLHYFPWNSPYTTGYWCPRITIDVGERQINLILGEARMPHLDLSPSSDNIAVIFTPHELPQWQLDAER